MTIRQAVLLLTASCLAQAEHFDIRLTAAADGGASQEASADQAPPEGGLHRRPILSVRAGDKLAIQFIMTNVYAHGSARNAGVRYYVVRESQIGQRTVPPLKDATVEGSFTFDLKPQARIGLRERIVISEPGIYLLRVESLRTQRDHEHFAAIDIEVK